ncbi:hypothetical protein BGZ94_007705 [Podila epigama]|nr:hypothetical protein BGZ94_007705 [Podila epigama]
MDGDKDMAKYIDLLKSAKADHEQQHLKSAYLTYLKAHSVIMRILSAQIVFRDQASLESWPNNYNQLLAHAQEILRRTKDIVDQAKDNQKKKPTADIAVDTLTSSAIGVDGPTRPAFKSSTSSQRTTKTTTTLTDKRTKRNTPMIPISPLTKQYLIHNFALVQATQKFEQAKQESNPSDSPSLSGPRDLANLRRLIEDVRIQRVKVDAINSQIQSVASSSITSWDPDVIAKQITIVDTLLFKEVAISRDLVRHDRKLSPAQLCIDFENYVAHSTSHLLLHEWSASRQPNTSNNLTAAGSSSKNGPPNAVAHLIRVAHILLHVYRNFNGFMAIMRALTSPEIKRMHKLWAGVNSKTKDIFRRLATIYQDPGGRGGYMDTLSQKLEAFQDVGKDAIVAVPWIRFHQDEVKAIINSYLTGHDSNDVVLSAPGARKLSAVTAILLQCRINEPSAFDRPESVSQTTNTKNREPVVVDGLRAPITPVWDLLSLGSGDITLHHWLLSRPYLNKQQLIDESLEIEPLFNGEELACYDTVLDEEDDEEDNDVGNVSERSDASPPGGSFEHVIAPELDLEPLPAKASRPAISRSPVSESEINAIMNELLEDDSEENGLFDDHDPDDSATTQDRLAPPANERLGQLKESSGRTRDVLSFLGIDPDEYNDSDSDQGDIQSGADSAGNGFKGKGKAVVRDEGKEIDDLLAKVKGLVQESRDNSNNLEYSSSLYDDTRDENDEDSEELAAMMALRSRGKFEPMQQGTEEDELTFHDDEDVPIISSEPAPASTLSLESLRSQLRELDEAEEGSTQHVDVKETNEATSSKAPPPTVSYNTEAKNDTTVSDNIEPKNDTTVPDNTEPKNDIDHVSAGDGSSTSSATSQTSPQSQQSPSQSPSANPFAAFMIRKPIDIPDGGALGTSPPPSIGKGRRRKIQTDRSKQSPENTTNSARGDKSPLALSPPRVLFSNASLDVSKDDKAAIEERARMSLAGYLQKGTTTAAVEAAVVPNVVADGGNGGDEATATVSSILDESALDRDQGLVQGKMEDGKVRLSTADLAAASSDEASPPKAEDPDVPTEVTLEELNKKSLDSSQPSLEALGSSSSHASTILQTKKMTTTTITTSTTSTTSTTVAEKMAENNKDKEESMPALIDTDVDGAGLQPKHQVDDIGAAGVAVEAPVSKELQQPDVEDVTTSDSTEVRVNPVEDNGQTQGASKDDDGRDKDGMLSAGEGGASEGKSPRARQRRRIVAGGVISLPVSGKGLASMSSTSSLSNAFKAGASSINSSNTEHLKEGDNGGSSTTGGLSGSEGKGSPEMDEETRPSGSDAQETKTDIVSGATEL